MCRAHHAGGPRRQQQEQGIFSNSSFGADKSTAIPRISQAFSTEMLSRKQGKYVAEQGIILERAGKINRDQGFSCRARCAEIRTREYRDRLSSAA
jgi:hypothetical protein